MNNTNAKPNLALLIDADNISAKYLPIILNEIPRYGVTTYRRIYGDFTDPQAASWRQKLLDNNITPIQQFSNVKSHKRGEKAGKNATDSTLIIDAMDILYAGKVDGFVIVSSDSDFTRLASRLRESNMLVVGMGRNQTAISFRHACTKFVNIEALYKMEQAKDDDNDTASGSREDGDIETTVTLADVESVVAGIIRDDENKGRETTSLAIIGGSLNDKFPDFDVRNFGYSQLYKLIEELGRFELIKVENGYNVRIKDDAKGNAEILEYMCGQVRKAKSGKLGIASLATRVYKQFPNFNLKDAGYSQFYKFAASFPTLNVTGEGARKYVELAEVATAATEEETAPADKRVRRRRTRKVEQAAEAPEAEAAETPAVETAEEAPAKPARRRRTRKSTEVTETAEQPQPTADENAAKDTAADAPAKQTRRRTRKTEQAASDTEVKEQGAKQGGPTKKEVYAFMEDQLKAAKDNTIGMAPLATKVRKRFPEFDLHALGFRQFFELVESSKYMSVVGEGRGRKATLAR